MKFLCSRRSTLTMHTSSHRKMALSRRRRCQSNPGDGSSWFEVSENLGSLGHLRFVLFLLFLLVQADTISGENGEYQEIRKGTKIADIGKIPVKKSHDDPNDEFKDFLYSTISNPNLYSSSIRPRVGISGGSPLLVNIQLYVNNFGPVDEMRMEYSMDMYIRIKWMDSRLANFDLHQRNASETTLATSYCNKIWVPDIFIPNEKKGSFHYVTKPNIFVKISPNGIIRKSIRVTLRLNCNMDLFMFPHDRQTCLIQLESYGYPMSEMILSWLDREKDDKPVIFEKEEVELPQFILQAVHTRYCAKQFVTGNFSCLEARFHLSRGVTFYLLQYYIPSILIVVLSWVSFYLGLDSTIGRTALGVITVLTVVTQLSSLHSSVPRVSYAKAIDIWLIMCLLLVYLTFLEFATVHYLWRRTKMIDLHEGIIRKRQVLLGQRVNDRPTLAESKVIVDRKKLPNRVDKIAMIVFPVAFAVVNAVYWSYYMSAQMSDLIPASQKIT